MLRELYEKVIGRLDRTFRVRFLLVYAGVFMVWIGNGIIQSRTRYLWAGAIGAFLVVSGGQAVLWSIGIRNELLGTAESESIVFGKAELELEPGSYLRSVFHEHVRKLDELQRQKSTGSERAEIEELLELRLKMLRVQNEIEELERKREQPRERP